jgi:predicted RNase H-like nuclease (RuvC/YqgF family)
MTLEHVVSERDQVLATVLNQQNQLIDSLRQELKEVNQTSIEQIKELGRKGDDALIEAKVKSINLQDEVSQQKNIIDELREQFLKSQETIKLLKQEIERQRKFTQEVVKVPPVPQYEPLTLQLEE